MAALRAQNKLALAAWQGMKYSYAANEEVTAVRAQLAALSRGSLPSEVATAATALDAKLAKFGGAVARAALNPVANSTPWAMVATVTRTADAMMGSTCCAIIPRSAMAASKRSRWMI